LETQVPHSPVPSPRFFSESELPHPTASLGCPAPSLVRSAPPCCSRKGAEGSMQNVHDARQEPHAQQEPGAHRAAVRSPPSLGQPSLFLSRRLSLETGRMDLTIQGTYRPPKEHAHGGLLLGGMRHFASRSPSEGCRLFGGAAQRRPPASRSNGAHIRSNTTRDRRTAPTVSAA